MDILNKKIIISTHYFVYGAPQALREYLIKSKIDKLIFIAHPLEIDRSRSYIEYVNNGDIIKKHESKLRSNISILNYFIEICLTLIWLFANGEKFDLFIGVDSLNSFVGLLLKKVGYVRKVVFYTIDYVPNRFNNKLLNYIYHRLDKFCLKNADETWNVSPRIAEGREKLNGLNHVIYNKQRVVPIGVWFDRVKRLPFDQINRCQLLFVGNLLEKQGVQIVFESIPKIIKVIPDFHFLIVGGGEYENILREMVKKKELEKYVTFTGWIKNRKKLDTIMADSAIAIAMYDKTKDNFTYYADPTKLKDYLSAGLPILLTDVPHNAKELEHNKCGIIIDYDVDKVKNAIIDLMKNEFKLKEYRKNAENYIKRFDYNIIFEENLNRILNG